jgi:hypothetical protein
MVLSESFASGRTAKSIPNYTPKNFLEVGRLLLISVIWFAGLYRRHAG